MYADAFGVWNTVSRNDPLARCELSLETCPITQGNSGVGRQSARLRDPDFLPGETENADMDGVLFIMVWEEPQIFQIFAFPNIQKSHQPQGDGPLICGSPSCLFYYFLCLFLLTQFEETGENTHRQEENIRSTWSAEVNMLTTAPPQKTTPIKCLRAGKLDWLNLLQPFQHI